MKPLIKPLLTLLVACAASVALLLGADRLSAVIVEHQQTGEVRAAFGDILPAENYEALDVTAYAGVLSAYRALDEQGTLLGFAVDTTVKGYVDDIVVHVALSPDGTHFLGLRIGEQHETDNLGARITESAFTEQFRDMPAPAYLDGYTGLERTVTPEDTVTAVTGATVSSKAVVKAANIAYHYVQDAHRGV